MAALLHVTGAKPIYNQVPTLEHTASVKIATRLCDRSIRYWVNHYVKYYSYDNCHTCQLELDVGKLELAEQITRNLRNVVRRIVEEIFRWMSYHERRFSIYKNSDYKVPLPTELCWTTIGAIDWSKTAQALVKDANLPLDLRYKLACNYCFENDVLDLWNMASEFLERTGQSIKRRKCESGTGYLSSIASADRWLKLLPNDLRWKTHVTLHFMWNIIVKKRALLEDMLQEEDLHYVVQFLTGICQDDNKAAWKYLYPYLTEDLRNRMWEKISNSKGKILHKECYFYLLSLMDERQQANFFQKSKYSVAKMLCYCMCWPHQDSFIPVANSLMPMASPDDFLHVLEELASMAERDYQAPRLFAEFWKAGSDSHRQHVIEQCGSSFRPIDRLFKRLHKSHCGGCIRLIWNDCTAQNKMDILSYFERTACSCDKKAKEAMEDSKNCRYKQFAESIISKNKELSTFLHLLIEMLERAG